MHPLDPGPWLGICQLVFFSVGVSQVLLWAQVWAELCCFLSVCLCMQKTVLLKASVSKPRSPVPDGNPRHLSPIQLCARQFLRQATASPISWSLYFMLFLSPTWNALPLPPIQLTSQHMEFSSGHFLQEASLTCLLLSSWYRGLSSLCLFLAQH